MGRLRSDGFTASGGLISSKKHDPGCVSVARKGRGVRPGSKAGQAPHAVAWILCIATQMPYAGAYSFPLSRFRFIPL